MEGMWRAERGASLRGNAPPKRSEDSEASEESVGGKRPRKAKKRRETHATFPTRAAFTDGRAAPPNFDRDADFRREHSSARSAALHPEHEASPISAAARFRRDEQAAFRGTRLCRRIWESGCVKPPFYGA